MFSNTERICELQTVLRVVDFVFFKKSVHDANVLVPMYQYDTVPLNFRNYYLHIKKSRKIKSSFWEGWCLT